MTANAARFIDGLGLASVDVLGHSMGGEMAQMVALERPDLVHRHVLVGTGPRAERVWANSRRTQRRCSQDVPQSVRTCGYPSCSRLGASSSGRAFFSRGRSRRIHIQHLVSGLWMNSPILFVAENDIFSSRRIVLTSPWPESLLAFERDVAAPAREGPGDRR